MTWQLVHIYVPAPYKSPGIEASVARTVLPHLFGRTPANFDGLLDADWLDEVTPHRLGYRRFQISLVDRRHYQPIPVTFLLKYNGQFLV